MKRLAILFVVSAAFLSACTGAKLVRTPVAKQNYLNVTLEQRQEKGTTELPKYQHPFMIELAELKKGMGDLTYIEKVGLMGAKQPNPVFNAVEIDRLAPVLAEALAKADARQRIRFVSFNQSKVLIFSESRETEGVIFVDSDGRLNFAFNYINADRQPSETSAIYHVFSSIDPLQIKSSGTTLSPTAPYAELHQFGTGQQAPMWIAINLDEMKKTAGTVTAPLGQGTEKAVPAVAPGTGTMAAPAETTAPAPASEDQLKEDIRNNLRYLKELLDEGLISEKDYTVKKMELLDKIK
jgi:hypothetical protein